VPDSPAWSTFWMTSEGFVSGGVPCCTRSAGPNDLEVGHGGEAAEARIDKSVPWAATTTQTSGTRGAYYRPHLSRFLEKDKRGHRRSSSGTSQRQQACTTIYVCGTCCLSCCWHANDSRGAKHTILVPARLLRRALQRRSLSKAMSPGISLRKPYRGQPSGYSTACPYAAACMSDVGRPEEVQCSVLLALPAEGRPAHHRCVWILGSRSHPATRLLVNTTRQPQKIGKTQ
jgi:hypothetical protein